MRFFISLAVSLTVLILAIPASGQAPIASFSTPSLAPLVAPKQDCPTRWEHRQLLRKSVRYSATNGDYHASPINPKALHELGVMRKCAAETRNWDALRQERKDYRAKMKAWRFHKYIDEITPFGAYAIPTYIVYRESKGTRCIINQQGSDAGGWYQILNSTWTGGGGRPIARRTRSYADCAPAWEQHLVAHRLWNGGSGSSHWALTR